MTNRREFAQRLLAFAGVSTGGLSSMSDATKAKERLSARAAGFRVPLESNPHAATFLQWPSRVQLYGGQRQLEAVQSKIALIAKTIARFEPVIVLASPDQIRLAEAALEPAIAVWPIPTDDLWCRDSGPTFVVSQDGRLAVVDFNFNGWGGKQSHDRDRKIARRVAEKLNLPVFSNGLVGEAGGVEVDGDGTAIAHESSWINRNRNRQSKSKVEQLLRDSLGAERVIWSPGIKGGDITDYHIDSLVRFVKPGQVVIQLGSTIDREDPWSVAAFETYANLKSARDAHGRSLDIIVLSAPIRPRVRSREFVSSYVNYYVCNGAVIGANFGDDKADGAASAVLSSLYPGREIVSLNIDSIAAAGGGIHCATQQKPAVKV